MKGHLLASIISFILFGFIVVGMVNAYDKEFLIKYAKDNSLSINDIHYADSEDECKGYFDIKYGICIR